MIEDGLHPQHSLALADRAFMRPRVRRRFLLMQYITSSSGTPPLLHGRLHTG